MSLTYRLACSFACLLALAPFAALARSAPAKTPALLLVLDASLAMAEPVESAPKLTLARDALAKLIDVLPDSSQAGLIAFGHRSPDRCDDVQPLAPIAALDKAALTAAVAKLVPKGKAALVAATRRALELARARKAPATVVLVSAGLDGCGASLCDAVKQAKAAGGDLVLNVVGFGVQGDAEPLRCAAQAGGGRYFAAGNAKELAAALDQSVAALRVPTGLLTITASAEGKAIEAVAEVRQAGGGSFSGRKPVNAGGGAAPATFRLPGGAYDLRVTPKQRGLAPYQALVELVAGRQAAQAASFGPGSLHLTVTHNGAALTRAPSVRLRRPGEPRALAVGASTLRKTASKPEQGLFELALASGTYDIEVTTPELGAGHECRTRAVVEAGQTATQTCDFASGAITVGATRGGKPVAVTIAIRQGGERGARAAGGATTAAQPTKSFVLAPGAYELEVSAPKLRARKIVPITVKAKDASQQNVEL